MRVKLTPAQRTAVQIYVTDPVHECTELQLTGIWLVLACSPERACEIITDGANSADDRGPGRTNDPGCRDALSNLSRKIRVLTR